jgi:phosphoglycolate phosphatase-like HAD superfamily hydrolase
MIGDTVDDIKASISAGVIPFGVVAPGVSDAGEEFSG